MSWSDIAKAAETIAPTIASTVLGPLGGLGVSAIEKVFGLTPQPSASLTDRTDAAAAAIAGATPDQLLALKKADQDFQVQMASLGYKDAESLARLAEQDTVSARDMQVANKSYVPAVLTYALVLGFFGMLVMLCFVTVPPENRTIVYSFVTTLGVLMPIAVHFWFGTTQDSGRKTELLAQQIPPAGGSQ